MTFLFYFLGDTVLNRNNSRNMVHFVFPQTFPELDLLCCCEMVRLYTLGVTVQEERIVELFTIT